MRSLEGGLEGLLEIEDNFLRSCCVSDLKHNPTFLLIFLTQHPSKTPPSFPPDGDNNGSEFAEQNNTMRQIVSGMKKLKC